MPSLITFVGGGSVTVREDLETLAEQLREPTAMLTKDMGDRVLVNPAAVTHAVAYEA